MGLFGNKDVKKLEHELMALRVALTLGPGVASSAQHFQAGVASAQADSVLFATRIKEAGKQAEGRAVVSKVRNNTLQGDAKNLFDGLLSKVEAALS